MEPLEQHIHETSGLGVSLLEYGVEARGYNPGTRIDAAQAFIDGLADSRTANEPLLIPGGMWYTTRPLPMVPVAGQCARPVIRGVGHELAVIFYDPAPDLYDEETETYPPWMPIEGMQRFVLEGFSVKGYPLNNKQGVGIALGAGAGLHTTRSVIRDVMVYNLGKGIDARFTDDVLFENVQVQGNGIGIDLDGTHDGGWSNVMELIGCRIDGKNDIGILCRGGSVVIVGGVIQGNGIGTKIVESTKFYQVGTHYEGNTLTGPNRHMEVGQDPGPNPDNPYVIDSMHLINLHIDGTGTFKFDRVRRLYSNTAFKTVPDLGPNIEWDNIKNPAEISVGKHVPGRQPRGVAVSRAHTTPAHPTYAVNMDFLSAGGDGLSPQMTWMDAGKHVCLEQLINFTPSLIPAETIRAEPMYQGVNGYYPGGKQVLRLDVIGTEADNTRSFWRFKPSLIQRLSPYEFVVEAKWFHPEATPRIVWDWSAIYDYDDGFGTIVTGHRQRLVLNDPMAVYWDGKRDRWYDADFNIPWYQVSQLDENGLNSFGHQVTNPDAMELELCLRFYVNEYALGTEWMLLEGLALFNGRRVRDLNADPVGRLAPAHFSPNTLHVTGSTIVPNADVPGAFLKVSFHADGTLTAADWQAEEVESEPPAAAAAQPQHTNGAN